MVTDPLHTLYRDLLDRYGPQGWWPLHGHAGSNPTKTGSVHGYHPGRYDLPDTEEGRFEVAVGAVLTQNTAWPNVETAIRNLADLHALSPKALLELDQDTLRDAIRSSGYYNLKAKKLRHLADFVAVRGGLDPPPERGELLSVWGVGPETADGIRLYACHRPEMVVDAYTRRILAAHGFCGESVSYDALKQRCVQAIPVTVPDYQEFHALMVEHGKHIGKGGTGASQTLSRKV